MLKRPFSRSFGDHDYCQVLKTEATMQRKVLKSWEPLGQVESDHKRRIPAAHYQGLDLSGKEAGSEMLWKNGIKQLRDQEIRASLTKHFGFLDSALDDDMAFCKIPEYDNVFEDSCSESGSPVEEEEEEEEEHGDTKLCLRRNPHSRTSSLYCSRSRSSSGSSCCRSRSPASRRTFRYRRVMGRAFGTVLAPAFLLWCVAAPTPSALQAHVVKTIINERNTIQVIGTTSAAAADIRHGQRKQQEDQTGFYPGNSRAWAEATPGIPP